MWTVRAVAFDNLVHSISTHGTLYLCIERLHQQNPGPVFGVFSRLWRDAKALKDQKTCIFGKMLVIFSEQGTSSLKDVISLFKDVMSLFKDVIRLSKPLYLS